jgi:hypothetical protein
MTFYPGSDSPALPSEPAPERRPLPGDGRPQPAQPADGGHAGAGHAEETGQHGHLQAGASGHDQTRMSTLIAVSIALVSVLGAIVGWRAELHGSRAGRYEQDAVATAITAAQVRSHAGTVAAQAASQYEHFVRLGRDADQLQANACNSSISPTDISSLDAGALCSTQVEFSGYSNGGYVTNGRFDLGKYSADVVAADSITKDIDSKKYLAQAEDQHAAEHRMLWLSLLLALALVWLTVARLQRRRVTQLALAVPGWLCLTAGIVLLVAAEV